MLKFKKWIALLGAVVLCLAVFTACNTQEKLSTGFDEEKVKAAVGKVIQAVNEQDSDALRELSDDTMKSTLTDDSLAPVYQAIGEGGEFQEIKDINIAGATDKETKVEYAVAVARAQYEKKAFVYTISFTKDMKLAGLYYK
jgi:predicted lipid-binding transport protein (Tim44 family)